MNNIGPRIEPCGTPHNVLYKAETPLIRTAWNLPEKTIGKIDRIRIKAGFSTCPAKLDEELDQNRSKSK